VGERTWGGVTLRDFEGVGRIVHIEGKMSNRRLRYRGSSSGRKGDMGGHERSGVIKIG